MPPGRVPDLFYFAYGDNIARLRARRRPGALLVSAGPDSDLEYQHLAHADGFVLPAEPGRHRKTVLRALSDAANGHPVTRGRKVGRRAAALEPVLRTVDHGAMRPSPPVRTGGRRKAAFAAARLGEGALLLHAVGPYGLWASGYEGAADRHRRYAAANVALADEVKPDHRTKEALRLQSRAKLWDAAPDHGGQCSTAPVTVTALQAPTARTLTLSASGTRDVGARHPRQRTRSCGRHRWHAESAESMSAPTNPKKEFSEVTSTTDMLNADAGNGGEAREWWMAEHRTSRSCRCGHPECSRRRLDGLMKMRDASVVRASALLPLFEVGSVAAACSAHSRPPGCERVADRKIAWLFFLFFERCANHTSCRLRPACRSNTVGTPADVSLLLYYHVGAAKMGGPWPSGARRMSAFSGSDRTSNMLAARLFRSLSVCAFVRTFPRGSGAGGASHSIRAS